MTIRLGINTGFAVNRFPEPEEWIRIVGEELNLRYVQFTAEMLNPALPPKIIKSSINQIQENLERYDVKVQSTFTGAYTRVNHLSHPDEAIRRYWIAWFKRYADISLSLGAKAMGSHFGILSVKDLKNPTMRKKRTEQNIEAWREIARYAKSIGLEYLLWEPMSIPREYGETLAAAEWLQAQVNKNLAIPMLMCLDVDHGDVSSNNPKDTDPYEWIAKFGKESPVIHLKQSSQNKHGHWPFTPQYNEAGKIQPKKIIQAIGDAGAQDVTLLFEFSFREREPYESNILSDLKASVEYWRTYVKE